MMRVQLSTRRRLLGLLVGLCLLCSAVLVAAQEDDPPAPQFLYHDEDRLILVDGYTGEAIELPLEVTTGDRFAWSPDGRYLLARLAEEDGIGHCLALYDFDAQAWVYNEPIDCTVTDAIFSIDGTQLVYTTWDGINGAVWLYTLTDDTRQQLYRTTEGDELGPHGVSSLEWSPTGAYLTFVAYRQIMGGTLNTFVVMNFASQEVVTLNAPSSYYASYHPVWSPDEQWFLLVLQDEYVTSGALAVTNHEGDVYLVHTATGERHRLTYSPAYFERNLHWMADGRIAFEEVIPHQHVYTIDEALVVEPVPADEIVTPEPVNSEEYIDPFQGVMRSPDFYVGAWVAQSLISGGGVRYELHIGHVYPLPREAVFTLEMTRYQQSNLIGWRPSEYHYPKG